MGFFSRLFGTEGGSSSEPQEAPQALKEQAAVFDQLGPEGIACIPADWTNAVLEIKCDGKRIEYSLKNRRSQSGKAVLSQRLAQLCEQLYLLMASQGHRWTAAELRYDLADEGWRFSADFKYRESA